MKDERIRQLSDLLLGMPQQWLAGFPLQLDALGVHGRYFKCVLRSQFEPDVGWGQEVARAVLDARGPDGAAFPADRLFRLPSGADGLLKLDRMCRLMHALNHFIVERRENALLLSVHTRLFDQVKSAHGRVFAQMLRHFGLAAEGVVLEVPDDLPDIVLDSYGSEGFGLHLVTVGGRPGERRRSRRPPAVYAKARYAAAPGP